MKKQKDKTFYRVNYRDHGGRVMTINAKQISDSPLGISFVAISDFIFETDSVLVNPDEEAKKIEFENIKTLHLSIHSIMSICELGGVQALQFENDKSSFSGLARESSGSSQN